MFQKLTEFSYKRNSKEAIGFYLAYLAFGLILGGIIGGLASLHSGATTFNEGLNAGMKAAPIVTILGTLYSLAISFTVLIQRKLYKNFLWVILALLGGLITIFGGLLLSLLIPALMTTRSK